MKKLFILFFIILLIGCNKLDSGIVIDKEFVPKHTQTVMVYTYLGNNTWKHIPRLQIIPDKWYVTIEGTHNNKIIKETFSLTENSYENIKIGDFITRSKYDK